MAKILVADDSLTIQKVVGITLSNGPYELDECLTEDELLTIVSKSNYDLILLDFNLSAQKSGYDLISEIQHLNPTAKVLVMLGTFDSVDDEKLKQSGAKDKIVKPFESSKFIEKCQTIINENQSTSTSENNKISEEISSNSEDSTSDWVINSPNLEKVKTPDINFSDSPKNENQLNEEMKGWGIDVPKSIGSGAPKDLGSFPPVINESDDITGEFNTDDIKIEFGRNDEEDSSENFEIIEEQITEDVLKPKGLRFPSLSSKGLAEGKETIPKLVPLDELNIDAAIEEEQEEEQEIEIQFDDMPRSGLIESIEEDVTPDQLWSVDEPEEIEEIEVEEPEFVITDENKSQDRFSENSSTDLDPGSQEEIVDQITAALSPMIKEMVASYCQKKVEEVAWEIIPDLAENLIKKEIEKISKSIQE
jgi:CheY-like chemotaxis protein